MEYLSPPPPPPCFWQTLTASVIIHPGAMRQVKGIVKETGHCHSTKYRAQETPSGSPRVRWRAGSCRRSPTVDLDYTGLFFIAGAAWITAPPGSRYSGLKCNRISAPTVPAVSRIVSADRVLVGVADTGGYIMWATYRGVLGKDQFPATRHLSPWAPLGSGLRHRAQRRDLSTTSGVEGEAGEHKVADE